MQDRRKELAGEMLLAFSTAVACGVARPAAMEAALSSLGIEVGEPALPAVEKEG
jgi:hypothetical protein